jgi:hypothetical protein
MGAPGKSFSLSGTKNIAADMTERISSRISSGERPKLALPIQRVVHQYKKQSFRIILEANKVQTYSKCF